MEVEVMINLSSIILSVPNCLLLLLKVNKEGCMGGGEEGHLRGNYLIQGRGEGWVVMCLNPVLLSQVLEKSALIK